MSLMDPTIHVYANGHGFVVVPVLIDAAGHEVEGTPANLAALTLGASHHVGPHEGPQKRPRAERSRPKRHLDRMGW